MVAWIQLVLTQKRASLNVCTVQYDAQCLTNNYQATCIGHANYQQKNSFSFSWTILLHLAILVFGIHS